MAAKFADPDTIFVIDDATFPKHCTFRDFVYSARAWIAVRLPWLRSEVSSRTPR
jgi:hypothetical protein